MPPSSATLPVSAYRAHDGRYDEMLVPGTGPREHWSPSRERSTNSDSPSCSADRRRPRVLLHEDGVVYHQ